MNKKIIISLSVIGVVAAIAIGGTIAYFNDTETSTGNVFVAGSIDLKVDHVKQTYNDIDCKTCEVKIVSDTSNMVIARNDIPLNPVGNALLVSSPNSRWTADVGNSNAKWIWATDPTLAEDTYDTSYTFTKNFEWYGPFTDTTLNFSVSSDNSVVVYLNSVEVGRNDSEFGYQIPISISFTPEQGTNELKFVVTNWDQSHDPSANPAGLLYALTIDGNCGDDYFKTHCTLFGIKDLGPGDHFWMFNDVKPGDRGTNVISLHVDSNDAYVCLINSDIYDQENVLIETEADAGDESEDEGELSDYLELFIWNDLNGDGEYDPPSEENLYEGDFITTEMIQLSLASGGLDYLGVNWCLGNQTVNNETGEVSCSGSGNQDKAQTDKLLASVILYAEQQRNNSGFSCENVELSVQPQ